jgi:copper(I)-binding protein
MLSRRSLILAAALSALALPLARPAAAQDHPEQFHVHDAYARSNGGAGGTGAVFFLLHNNGTEDDLLVGARTDLAEKAELHTHVMTADGVMQMREIAGGVPMPAGEMHEFVRGGDHVMLMGLTRALQDGEHFPLVLSFASGAQLTLDVVVDNARKPGAPMGDGQGEMMMDHDHGGMDHGSMDHGSGG